MKLLLTSAGISNKKIINALAELLQKPFDQSTLAFVPTAANVEEGDKGWLINDYINFSRLGLKSLDIVDISALPQDIWLPRLKFADIIVFSGGNTFYTMDWLRKSDLINLLPGLLEDKVFVGISAGSMIVSPKIILTMDKSIYAENEMGVLNDKGLGLVDFYIRPHFNSDLFPLAKESIVEEASKNISESIYTLDDSSAVKVDGDDISVISEGKWKKFN